MSTMHTQQMVASILGDGYSKQIISELGIESDTPDAQAELISAIGENIMMRLTLEILKILPESEHPKFDSFMGSGDIIGLREFLRPFIPDFDRFVQHEAMAEFETTKTRLREMEHHSV